MEAATLFCTARIQWDKYREFHGETKVCWTLSQGSEATAACLQVTVLF